MIAAQDLAEPFTSIRPFLPDAEPTNRRLLTLQPHQTRTPHTVETYESAPDQNPPLACAQDTLRRAVRACARVERRILRTITEQHAQRDT